MKKFNFIRWGGLSSVKQKGYVSENKIKEMESGEDFFSGFHKPPLRRGVYCFLEGFVEMFLVGWKLYKEDGSKKKECLHPRKFSYSGKIWTHIEIIHPEIKYYRKKTYWFETDTDSLTTLIKEEIKRLNKMYSDEKYFTGDLQYRRYYKFTNKDHFEFFIEKV